MEWFDANVVVGRPQKAGIFAPLPDAAALRAHLAAQGISRALVSHWAQGDTSPITANALVDEVVRTDETLYGCWAVLPPVSDPLVTADFFPRMRDARAAVLAMMPKAHRYVLDPVVWGGFIHEVAERGVPVVFSMEDQVDWADLYRFLRDVPRLTCILRNIGTWSMDRYTYPLLDAYENVHLETGMLSIEDGGVEGVVHRFGPERLLFGTGFPVRYAEASMLELTHADIEDGARAAIASENLARLIAGADYA
jgi:predicted TIM-barrel fold metal-dependent hydrolase